MSLTAAVEGTSVLYEAPDGKIYAGGDFLVRVSDGASLKRVAVMDPSGELHVIRRCCGHGTAQHPQL